MISLNTTIHLLKKLDVTELNGEKVTIDFETGKYYLLSGSGNEIWDYIQEDITVSEIIDRLQQVYDVDFETCKKSVIEFLSNLEKNHIIRI